MKILLLFSGGLDSILSYKLLKSKGFFVKAVQFYTPFLQIIDKNFYIKNIKELYSIDLKMISIWDDYREIILKPKYGFGKNMNPCLDCKLLFYKKGREIMENENFDILATGEVGGQRPFSQKVDNLNFLERESGLRGRVLRPLCYKYSTQIPDQDFLDIMGRGRSKQIQLAKELNVDNFPEPGGGCLLAESSFCGKIKILIDFFDHDPSKLEEIYFEMLKFGRVFESQNYILIIGRDKLDGDSLMKTHYSKPPNCRLIFSRSHSAPVSAVIFKNMVEDYQSIFDKIKKFVKSDYRHKISFEVV